MEILNQADVLMFVLKNNLLMPILLSGFVSKFVQIHPTLYSEIMIQTDVFIIKAAQIIVLLITQAGSASLFALSILILMVIHLLRDVWQHAPQLLLYLLILTLNNVSLVALTVLMQKMILVDACHNAHRIK